MIADDAGFVRDLLREACLSLGFQVVGEARDGREVVDMASRLRPDVIVMDLVMPYWNGLEATEKVVEIRPGTHIIACSSMDDELTIKQAADKGCQAFLRKPFSKQSIQSVFQQIEIQRRGVEHA